MGIQIFALCVNITTVLLATIVAANNGKKGFKKNAVVLGIIAGLNLIFAIANVLFWSVG